MDAKRYTASKHLSDNLPHMFTEPQPALQSIYSIHAKFHQRARIRHVSSGRALQCRILLGSLAASCKRPLLSVDVSVCLSVRNFDANISETKRFKGSCPIGTLQESAYGVSISDIIDDVAWLYYVMLLTSQSSLSSHSKNRTEINCPCGSFKHTVS